MPSKKKHTVVLLGTGTSIGKTHVSCAVLHHLKNKEQKAVGWKPVESGIKQESEGLNELSDLEKLAQYSHIENLQRNARGSFCVKGDPALKLRAPLSPHLACHIEGKSFDAKKALQFIKELEQKMDLVWIELPGGLCTPLSPAYLGLHFARDLLHLDRSEVSAGHAPPAPNGDRSDESFAAHLRERHLFIAAPDKLGALSEIGAAMRAFAYENLPPCSLLWIAPEQGDESTGTNPKELVALGSPLPLRATYFERFPVDQLSRESGASDVVKWLNFD